jgi:sugar O-acyltransferase (sialic acid O-acetyltransferase NeuD family)
MEKKGKILLIGAGGHCCSVLDSLISFNSYENIGIVDKTFDVEDKILTVMGIPVVGRDEELDRLYKDGYRYAFVTVGSVGDISIRKRLVQLIKKKNFIIPNIIDHTGIVSSYSSYGEGIYVGKRAVINANSQIGNYSIVNTSSIVEHGSTIDEFVHLAPGSIVCGDVYIGAGTHIGAGSIIRQGIHIGKGSIIGAGSVVVSNIDDNVVAYGNPCKYVRKL